jgi:hypothetical protein
MTGIARRCVAAVAPSLRAFAPPRDAGRRALPRRSARRGMAQAALAALLQRIA